MSLVNSHLSLVKAISYRHEADPPFTVDRLPKEDVGQRTTDNNHADG